MTFGIVPIVMLDYGITVGIGYLRHIRILSVVSSQLVIRYSDVIKK